MLESCLITAELLNVERVSHHHEATNRLRGYPSASSSVYLFRKCLALLDHVASLSVQFLFGMGSFGSWIWESFFFFNVYCDGDFLWV